jgi:two-component system, NtrC family, response regulator HydG
MHRQAAVVKCVYVEFGVYYYLTMLKGPRTGTHFTLQPRGKSLIGRGLDCQIVLTDPLCSRVHCELEQSDDGWMLRDHQSRNGTLVNGQKADEVRLVDGSEIKIGSVVFEFRASVHRPQGTSSGLDINRTQTIVHDRPVADDGGSLVINTFGEANKGPDAGLLFSLSVKLLGCGDPDEVIRTAIESIQERTQANVVGFLWASEDGQLKPKLVIPDDQSSKIHLSDALTDKVLRMGNAVWIDNHDIGPSPEESLHYADAICVPLMHDKKIMGAIHVYRETGRFHNTDFDVAIHSARILTIALVRARENATLKVAHQRLVNKVAAFDQLLGESKPMQDLKSRITRIARATGCVLIRGESGAGKELVARAVHKASQRVDRPMLSVNCAAIPRDLMESQLFGHKRGAFTGADTDHIGWFEQAHTGMLFLDEVGEMTLEGQAKLLRILEGHPFLPVGGNKEINVDVRVIAATNRDLREFVADGKFREDLYYRLSVFELYIPPLRERGPDVDLLVNYFLNHFRSLHGRPGLQLSEAAADKLRTYFWPGNVRQLRNVIDSCVVMSEAEVIQPEDLGLRDVSIKSAINEGGFDTLKVDVWEKRLIIEALKRCRHNVPEAAKLLGIGRATLYRKIDDYSIEKVSS